MFSLHLSRTKRANEEQTRDSLRTNGLGTARHAAWSQPFAILLLSLHFAFSFHIPLLFAFCYFWSSATGIHAAQRKATGTATTHAQMQWQGRRKLCIHSRSAGTRNGARPTVRCSRGGCCYFSNARLRAAAVCAHLRILGASIRGNVDCLYEQCAAPCKNKGINIQDVE